MKLLESLNQMVVDLKKRNENWGACINENDERIAKMQAHSEDCRKGIDENNETIAQLETLIAAHSC